MRPVLLGLAVVLLPDEVLLGGRLPRRLRLAEGLLHHSQLYKYS